MSFNLMFDKTTHVNVYNTIVSTGQSDHLNKQVTELISHFSLKSFDELEETLKNPGKVTEFLEIIHKRGHCTPFEIKMYHSSLSQNGIHISEEDLSVLLKGDCTLEIIRQLPTELFSDTELFHLLKPFIADFSAIFSEHIPLIYNLPAIKEVLKEARTNNVLQDVTKAGEAIDILYYLSYIEDRSERDAHTNLIKRVKFLSKPRFLHDLIEERGGVVPLVYVKKWVKDCMQKKALPHKEGLDVMEAFNRAKTLAEFYFLYSFGKAFDEAMLPDIPKGIPENYIVRKKNFATQCRYGNQEEYGMLMHRSIQQGGLLIHKGWKFDKLLPFFAFCRANIAKEQNQKDASDFGNPIDETKRAQTFCDESYAYLSDFIRNHLSGPNILLKSPGFYQLSASLENEPIDHTSFVIGSFKVLIEHTNATICKKILSKIEHIYNEALKNPEVIGDNAYESAGLIFWWICQAKPWERGDPSIAEMLVRSLLYSKGIDPGAWKEWVIPWVEVMKQYNPEVFAQNFKSLFANPT